MMSRATVFLTFCFASMPCVVLPGEVSGQEPSRLGLQAVRLSPLSGRDRGNAAEPVPPRPRGRFRRLSIPGEYNLTGLAEPGTANRPDRVWYEGVSGHNGCRSRVGFGRFRDAALLGLRRQPWLLGLERTQPAGRHHDSCAGHGRRRELAGARLGPALIGSTLGLGMALFAAVAIDPDSFLFFPILSLVHAGVTTMFSTAFR